MMKRVALIALWLTLAAEAGFFVWARLSLHATRSELTQPFIFFLLFLVLALLRERFFWYPLVIRVFLAYEFGSAVADRFGWLGPPGSGVAWGDFAHFVNYTHQVNAFLPLSFARPLAVLATICECTFTITLLLGIRTREAAAGAALLLCCFGLAMTASRLSVEMFSYAVFVLAAGAWYMSTIDATWLSIDQLLSRRKSANAE
jgi:putative oxidoreductase